LNDLIIGQNKWIVFKRGYTKWSIKHEMFNIPSHEGQADQNIIKIPSYPSQNDYQQENKQQQMLARVQRSGGGVVHY
jgi:hypothetical protein